MKPLDKKYVAMLKEMCDRPPEKNRPPAMLWYTADWLSATDTRVMTPTQRGAYADLLSHCWQKELALPADDKALALLSGLFDDWQDLKGPILATFSEHPFKQGFITHFKLIKVRHKQLVRADSVRERWNKRDTDSIQDEYNDDANGHDSQTLRVSGSQGSRVLINGVADAPPDDDKPDSPEPEPDSDEKRRQSDREVATRNWFAGCFKRVHSSYPAGFDPKDRRMSVQDRRACAAILKMHAKEREGQPGYIDRKTLEWRLYNALAGNYYKLRPPVNMAEFRKILDSCMDSALRPYDQRKRIPSDKSDSRGPSPKRYTSGPERRTGETPRGGFKTIKQIIDEGSKR